MFKLAELNPDNFKCLIFVQGLVSTKDAEIRRVLDKLENEANQTLQNLAEDCQRFINVRQDAKEIEASGVSHIQKVCQENKVKKKITRYPCYKRRELLFYNDCTKTKNTFFEKEEKDIKL